MPRPPKGRVGRSAGAAEHRVAKHRTAIALSRTTSITRATALARATAFARATALICVVAIALAGAPAVALAQTSSESLAGMRAAVDTAANQWFAAQRRSADLDLRIQMLDKTLADEQQRVAAIRSVAEARAVQIYEDNSQGLDSIMGNDPLELGRRAALIGQANSDSQHAIDELNASVADLTARRGQLRTARADLERSQRDLQSRRTTLDAELTSLQLSASRAANRTVLAAQVGKASRGPLAATATLPAPTTTPTTTAPRSTSAPTSVTPPPDTGAVSPHHDEPFLVCTRARESDGDYSAVSPSGYYGAYQFSPTTWNVSASHAGRLDLVGVLPSVASQYDQDEMAWSLYQWQGNAPWGGRC